MVLILLVRLLLSSSLSLSFQPSSLSNPGSPFSIFQFIFFEPFPVSFPFPSAYFWLLSFWNWALLSWYEIVSRSIIASKEETNVLSSVTVSCPSWTHRCSKQGKQDEYCLPDLFCSDSWSGQFKEQQGLNPNTDKAADVSLLQILQACMNCNAPQIYKLD